MTLRKLFILFCFLCSTVISQAQINLAKLHWFSPVDDSVIVIQGQGWPEELKGTYSRLPERAHSIVRPAVWHLSTQSAGLTVNFYSNASEIIVCYQVEGGYSMNHMPATGVSGVDLYAYNKDGQELWCAADYYNFGDTIQYDFNSLTYNEGNEDGYEYQLHFPLYNSVKWLKIGVPENSKFSFIPLRKEKPIVIYGTSITQGACASRPGMCWSSILKRKLNYPIINLGFSGNGRLEKEVLNFINEIDASLYILDCMPNLDRRSFTEIHDLLVQAVEQIRDKHPETPILITEHDGYTNQFTNHKMEEYYKKANKASKQAFIDLKSDGVKQLYYLSYEEIGMPQDAMVDGIHASDYGMTFYANAYEKKIRKILHMPKKNPYNYR